MIKLVSKASCVGGKTKVVSSASGIEDYVLEQIADALTQLPDLDEAIGYVQECLDDEGEGVILDEDQVRNATLPNVVVMSSSFDGYEGDSWFEGVVLTREQREEMESELEDEDEDEDEVEELSDAELCNEYARGKFFYSDTTVPAKVKHFEEEGIKVPATSYDIDGITVKLPAKTAEQMRENGMFLGTVEGALERG